MISTSIDNTIAKIIRDTRITDSSYLADMYEWIPEAMRLLKTNVEMKVTPKVLKVDNYLAKLPCGLIDLLAVSYQGQRLRYYTGIRPGGSIIPEQIGDKASIFTASIFTAYPTFNSMPSGDVLDLQYVATLPESGTEGYQLHMDYISTSFAKGEITIYFKEAPTDARGLPLIPDHPDYREAIYWFTRTKLIQAGYNDIVYGHDDRIAFERFEMYAARAIADITYPSVDQKEAQIAMGVRFIPPVDYYDSFFNTELTEPAYGYGTAPTATGFASPIGPLLNSQGQ